MAFIHLEGNVLFNDALNTFYLWLYGVGFLFYTCLSKHSGLNSWYTVSVRSILVSELLRHFLSHIVVPW